MTPSDRIAALEARLAAAEARIAALELRLAGYPVQPLPVGVPGPVPQGWPWYEIICKSDASKPRPCDPPVGPGDNP